MDSEANRVNGVDEVSGGARTAAGGGVGGGSRPRVAAYGELLPYLPRELCF